MPTAPRSLWAAATVLALLATAASAPAQPGPGQPPPAERKTSLKELIDGDKYPLKYDGDLVKKVRRERLEAYQAGTVGVFKAGPGASAAWAPKALDALELRAQKHAQEELCGGASGELEARSVRAAEDAVKAGCDDPLVRYAAEFPRTRVPQPDPKLIAALRDTVAALDKSTYPDRDKLYAVHNWLSLSTRALPAGDPLRKDEAAQFARFWELFERVAGENTPSGDAAVLELAALWEAPAPGRTRKQGYEAVARHLERGKASKYVRLVTEGRFLSREGWDARGTGFAGTVGPEAWKVFGDRVAAARDKFEAAWEADKTRFQAPTDLVRSCRDLGLERATMERWFERAMATNPDNRVACVRKMDYLHPKWKGSVEEFFAFGGACALSPNVEAGIPMAVLDAHALNAAVFGPEYAADPAHAARYYSQSLVWATASLALGRTLQASPEDVNVRTLCARVACLAGKWEIARGQFERLAGRYEARYFPEPGEYDRFVEQAKKLGAPKK